MTVSDEAPAAPSSDTAADTAPSTANPDSGVESLAVVAGAAALALGAMIVTKKRNK